MAAVMVGFGAVAAVAGAAFPPAGAVWRPVSGNWNTAVFTASAEWEHSAVQEPQVVWQPATKSLRMWYRGAGWSYPSSVGVADSTDGGKTWVKHPANPVWVGASARSAQCAGQPFVYLAADGTYWMMTNDNSAPRSCVTRSTDGINWVNASTSESTQVPLPPGGSLFGNRAFWAEPGEPSQWRLLQEVMTAKTRVWEIYLYTGTSPVNWTVGNGGQPLRQLQRHAGSMYGGCHIATVDGVFTPKDPVTKLYNIWYHAGAHGNLPTDIYHATSPDLVNWTVVPSGPVLSHQGTGSFAFDQVADPSPLTVGRTAYMAYDGDNNGCRNCSHAAIGFAVAPAATDG